MHLSTGYVQGSIPPTFREDNKKPINACGSDSIMILDARKNTNSLFYDCLQVMKQRKFIGFKIIRANSLLDKGHIILNYVDPIKIN